MIWVYVLSIILNSFCFSFITTVIIRFVTNKEPVSLDYFIVIIASLISSEEVIVNGASVVHHHYFRRHFFLHRYLLLHFPLLLPIRTLLHHRHSPLIFSLVPFLESYFSSIDCLYYSF